MERLENTPQKMKLKEFSGLSCWNGPVNKLNCHFPTNFWKWNSYSSFVVTWEDDRDKASAQS